MTSETQAPDIQNVHVMLLIAGGHQCQLSLPPDAPLLRELLEAVMNRSENHFPSRLFQIPIDSGGSTLYFPSASIVGIATDPPVPLPEPVSAEEVPLPEPVPVEKPIQPAALERQPDFVESRYLQFDNFLTPAESKLLLDYTLAKESAFVPSSVSSGDPSYRKSKILECAIEFSELLKNRIHAVLPEIMSFFGVPWFLVSDIECQLTAHNDGHFYKVHNDNGDSPTAARVFSYVYYFYREPKAFSGGELRIYDSKKDNDRYLQAESFKTVEPRNNSIVFFASSYVHEVLPVICPSRVFGDSRFTLNGWVRKN